MLRLAVVVVLLFSIASAQTSTSQNAVVRDPQAVSILQQAISAMATAVPADSVETGSVGLVAGSTTSAGTIQISTRGVNQTSVQVQSPSANWSVVYSQAQASRTEGGTSTVLSLELTSTSQCPFFPLPYLIGVLHNTDNTLQYLGAESLGTAPVQHLRIWNTFQSSPALQFLSDFTVTDVWLDTASGLLLRIFFFQRDSGGATPKIPVTIDYSNFQNSSGVLYPTQIQQSVNGTLYMSILITSASFNVGLTDADFSAVQGGN